MEEDLAELSIIVVEANRSKVNKFRTEYAQHNIHFSCTGMGTIHMLELMEWDVLFLGHEVEGNEISKWLGEHEDLRPARIIIHACDPDVARNIQGLLPDATWYPLALSRSLPDLD